MDFLGPEYDWVDWERVFKGTTGIAIGKYLIHGWYISPDIFSWSRDHIINAFSIPFEDIPLRIDPAFVLGYIILRYRLEVGQ